MRAAWKRKALVTGWALLSAFAAPHGLAAPDAASCDPARAWQDANAVTVRYREQGATLSLRRYTNALHRGR